MATRILTFHQETAVRNGYRYGVAYYIEEASLPVGIRIHTETAPINEDVEVDILDDGVSILSNRASTTKNPPSQVGPTLTAETPVTTAVLSKGDSTEDSAEDWSGEPIEKGSWVTCVMVNNSDAENITVHLVLAGLNDE